MRWLLLVLVVFACKPADRSQSEGKFANQLRKSVDALTKTQKLANKRAIKDAVKRAVDEGELDDLKKIIIKGDELADAASLAYYRTLQKRRKQALIDTQGILFNIDEIVGKIRANPASMAIEGEIRYLNANTEELSRSIRSFSSLIEAKALMTADIVKLSKNNKFDIAYGLCCRGVSTSNSPITKDVKTIRELFQSEFSGVTRVMNRLKSTRSTLIDSLDEVSIDHSIRQKNRLIFTDLEMARTELLGNLRDFERFLTDAIK